MRERVRRPGECFAKGDRDLRCTEDSGHNYAHYDASADESWTDRTEDHRDECTCDCCRPDLDV